MAKLAFIDHNGAMHSTAWTCTKEGHDVVYMIDSKNPKERRIGDGLVRKVEKEEEVIEFHPDVVYVYQDPHRVRSLKAKHLVAFGSSLHASKLESERLYAASLCNRYGIETPVTLRFDTVKEIKDFLETSEGKSRTGWVLKTEDGDASTTHVAESVDHLRSILDYEADNETVKTFILQQRIEGIEISIEGWFDYRLPSPEGPWIKPFNSTIECKRMMAGDVGPMTGCMGSVIWAWPGQSPKLFKQTLEKLTPFLTKIEYLGPLDINVIIDYKSRRPYFLEFTPRLGWNAWEAFMINLSEPWTAGEMLVQMGRGDLRKYSFRDTFSTVVRLFGPSAVGIPITAPYEHDSRYMPKDVYLDDKEVLRTVGTQGQNGMTCIMECGGLGHTIAESRREVYEDVIPNVKTTDLAYRNDIGEIERSIELLEKWGYFVTPRRQ